MYYVISHWYHSDVKIAKRVKRVSCYISKLEATKMHVLFGLLTIVPLLWSGSSQVTTSRIRTTVSQSTLFDHLINIWEFNPYPITGNCNLYVLVDFKFQSPLHR
ncbi:hypothetical protein AHAS_Ahas04G0154100 [Arachis hypogaea]